MHHINDKIEKFKIRINELSDKKIDIAFSNENIIIKANIMNGKIVTDIMGVALAIYMIWNLAYNPFYPFLILILFLILSYITLWVDFKSINIININFSQKTIELKSRSVVRRVVLKYLLKQKSIYNFNEIKGFDTTTNGAWKPSERRHFINMNLKKGLKIQLISFSKKNDSLIFLNFSKAILN